METQSVNCADSLPTECCICGEKYSLATTESIVIVKHNNDATLDISRKRGHYFHRSCLNLWKKAHQPPSCPLDRDPIGKTYTVPNYQLAGFEIGLYNYDFKDVLVNLKVTDRLLEQFPDIDEIDKNNCTLAFYACRIGNLTLINKLLKRSADFNKACGREGFTPLMIAVCQNHSKIVAKLLSTRRLQEGISNHDLSGMTAFGYACQNKYCSIIHSFLLNRIPRKHEVQYYLQMHRELYQDDKLFGKEIIDALCHYLKSDDL